MKSFMFSRLWHLLLQLASTVPRNIIKDKDKVKDKSAHLAHLLGPIFGLVAALGSWCVPVALYFAPACLLGGQRTFSLFHIVIAMNLRVWELPGFLPKNISRVVGFGGLHGITLLNFEALLKSRLCYWLSIDLLCRSPPGDQVGNLFSIWAPYPDRPKKCARTLPRLHSHPGPVTSKSHLHVLCFCISCGLYLNCQL